MDHDIDILLSKYFSGEATPEEKRMVEDWAQSSPEHYAAFVLQQNLWEKSATSRVKTYDAKAAWQKVVPRLKPNSKAKMLEARQWWIMAAAAAVVMLLIAGRFFFNTEGEQWQEEMATTEVRQVNLPDGSMVWLNRGAKFRFPKKFGRTNRRVQLEGEAFFEVARDTTKPFMIQSALASVEVLGTSFNFSTQQLLASLTVASGKVRFQGSVGDAVILHKGEMGVYDKGKGSIEKRMNTDPNYLSWKTGVFDFDGANLQQVIASLNTFYRDKPILSTPENINQCALSARFERLKIEAVLDILCASCGLHWKETANHFEVTQE